MLLAAACVWSALAARSYALTVEAGETIYLPQVDDMLTMLEPRCQLYADSMSPRSYSAVLLFAGATDSGRVLRVNHPVGYRGYRFYLMSFCGDSIGLVVRRNPSWLLLLLSLGLVCFGTVGLAVSLVRRDAQQGDKPAVWVRFAALLPSLVVAVFFVLRTVQAGHLPFANMYEAMLSFSLATLLFVVSTRDASPAALLIGVVLGAVLFILPARLSAIRPLPPALHSVWFEPHVAFAFAGYGGLVVAVLSTRRGPALPLAFAAFTLAVAFGAVWAEQAWARFWSWDPKETWSLVTWMFMAAAVGMRILRRPKLERIAAGFALAAVTYNFVIVNLILRGLHSYR